MHPTISKIGSGALLHIHYQRYIKLVGWLISQLLLSCLSLHQMTPLHVAAEKGDRLDIVEYLIKNGADINIIDYSGVSETTLLIEHQVPYPLFMYI